MEGDSWGNRPAPCEAGAPDGVQRTRMRKQTRNRRRKQHAAGCNGAEAGGREIAAPRGATEHLAWGPSSPGRAPHSSKAMAQRSTAEVAEGPSHGIEAAPKMRQPARPPTRQGDEAWAFMDPPLQEARNIDVSRAGGSANESGRHGSRRTSTRNGLHPPPLRVDGGSHGFVWQRWACARPLSPLRDAAPSSRLRSRSAYEHTKNDNHTIVEQSQRPRDLRCSATQGSEGERRCDEGRANPDDGNLHNGGVGMSVACPPHHRLERRCVACPATPAEKVMDNVLWRQLPRNCGGCGPHPHSCVCGTG